MERVGTGFDAHRLVSGRPLVLGGVSIPHDKGLAGHSDGDCLLHAVCDAILGALAAGDMGQHFPSNDPRWKDVDSRVFVKEVARLMRSAGLAVAHLDSTVIAEAPRLGPYLEEMRASIAALLQAEVASVSVKAKSADGLGAIGRGEGVAAFTTVLLRRG
ncbi:MAG TPA: 2-C-methyl-D-erythritol 2,4-cyclodiphosphate synthase [Vicinamibacteria bacterium]|nr:2-C-methyl-D-erythritol 2,4-cyclodiphosphate synthase [Vicinamibacteria bacterium]